VIQYNSLLEREPGAGKLSWHKGLLDEKGVLKFMTTFIRVSLLNT